MRGAAHLGAFKLQAQVVGRLNRQNEQNKNNISCARQERYALHWLESRNVDTKTI
jgi:hypothetical protein